MNKPDTVHESLYGVHILTTWTSKNWREISTNQKQNKVPTQSLSVSSPKTKWRTICCTRLNMRSQIVLLASSAEITSPKTALE